MPAAAVIPLLVMFGVEIALNRGERRGYLLVRWPGLLGHVAYYR